MEGLAIIILLLMLVGFIVGISSAGENKNKENFREVRTSGNPLAKLNDALGPVLGSTGFEKVDWGTVSLAEIKRLVESGADVNARGRMLKTFPDGRSSIGLSQTPLDCAADPEIAEYLIAQGADVNAEDKGFKLTPLHHSSTPEVAAVLLKHGADINHRSKEDETPLISVLKTRFYDVAEYLLDRGADINVIEKKTGKTPLCFFVSLDFTKKLLKMGADPNVVAEGKYTPLHYAALFGYIDYADLLIKYGADVNTLITGVPPLGYADDVDMVNFLLDKGADIELLDNNQETPLFHAAYGNVDAVRALVKRGANINAVDKYGNTPLHYTGDSMVTTYLLMVGIDPNAQNKYQETPLHIAVATDDLAEDITREDAIKKIEALLEYGADVNIKNDDGDTPLDIVKDPEVKDLLERHK